MVKIMRKEEAVHRNQFIKKGELSFKIMIMKNVFMFFFFAKIKFIINLLFIHIP